ncbi:MAG: VanW family protein [Thermoleophilia bacterium]|nr:VanW family protein [Thermoleophilia bacterium]
MDIEAPFRTVPYRRRRSVRARVLQWSLVAAALVALAVTGLGFLFAGSSDTLPVGLRIAGTDVGGLTVGEATKLLESRSRAVYGVPVVFVAGDKRWRISSRRLELKVDWRAAVEAARERGDGFGPVQGLRRLGVRFFGADVAPPMRVYEPALGYHLARMARGVNEPSRPAALRLRGLEPVVVPERRGIALHRAAAEDVVVRALAGFARRHAVQLPVRVDRPAVTAADLRPVAAKARRAVSAPVRISLGKTRWRLPRWRIARLLELPSGGSRTLAIGGPAADAYFGRLGRRTDRPARDAEFAVRPDGTVRVVPHATGRRLDVEATARAILAAALSRNARAAVVTVSAVAPERTTAQANAMGVRRLVAGYETTYGGDANRLHNVRLVAELIDGALIPPGKVFSFNTTTGERTAEKGFLEAPVIINGELQTGLGGGVCQVSTTVFNAAYEAGLPIVERTNHSLYISHYPQGRDATVNYPDLDLRFTNDTGRWLLLRTFVGSSSLVVNLYGAPTGRRVETETAPLVVTGEPSTRRVRDPSLYRGQLVVDDHGEPSRATSVRRRVYNRSGKLIGEATWHSSYRAEPKIVRVGTKRRAQAATKPKGEAKQQPTTTTAGTTTTPGATTTTPAP